MDKPFELAEILLATRPGMTPERIQAISASGKTETVHLAKPMPVLLPY